MRKIVIALCFCLVVSGLIAAQDYPKPYETALQRIDEARETNAEILELQGLFLTELPPGIGQLSSVRYVYLNTNFLTDLPSELWQLTNLRGLNLGNNRLTNLPPEIGRLTQLRWLSLSNNRLISLPEELGQLNNLCSLDLQRNAIRYLPNSLGNLTNFIRLQDCQVIDSRIFLDGNPLISPPPEIVAQGDLAILDYLQNEYARRKAEKQHLLLMGVSGVGLLAALMLGFRLKQRQHNPKKKREM